jgi:hypothetical protein
MRKAKRAAPSRERPSTRPVVIVTPERDTPGWRATAWPAPMSSASRSVTSSAARVPVRRSAHPSTRPNTISIVAMSQM